jgi:hypothetical protein
LVTVRYWYQTGTNSAAEEVEPLLEPATLVAGGSHVAEETHAATRPRVLPEVRAVIIEAASSDSGALKT